MYFPSSFATIPDRNTHWLTTITLGAGNFLRDSTSILLNHQNYFESISKILNMTRKSYFVGEASNCSIARTWYLNSESAWGWWYEGFGLPLYPSNKSKNKESGLKQWKRKKNNGKKRNERNELYKNSYLSWTFSPTVLRFVKEPGENIFCKTITLCSKEKVCIVTMISKSPSQKLPLPKNQYRWNASLLKCDHGNRRSPKITTPCMHDYCMNNRAGATMDDHPSIRKRILSPEPRPER